jgi:hypothetical protein
MSDNQFPQGIEKEVCEDITWRQQMGVQKYGMTVANNPLELRQWLQHAYEEALDNAIYLKRAISEIDKIVEGNPSISGESASRMIEALSSCGNYVCLPGVWGVVLNVKPQQIGALNIITDPLNPSDVVIHAKGTNINLVREK